MNGVSDGSHGNVGGGGTAGGAPVAAVAAPSNNSNNQIPGMTILNSMLVGAYVATGGSEEIGSAQVEGIEEGQFNPNAPIQGDDENGSGDGLGGDGENQRQSSENVTSSGGDSSSGYDSTSHEGSGAAVAQLMGSTLYASEIEAEAAQVESVDGIKNSLEGSNAQLSCSAEAASKQEEGTDVAAEGAIAGAAVTGAAAAFTMGGGVSTGMSEEDQEMQQGLKNTQDALHEPPPSEATEVTSAETKGAHGKEEESETANNNWKTSAKPDEKQMPEGEEVPEDEETDENIPEAEAIPMPVADASYSDQIPTVEATPVDPGADDSTLVTAQPVGASSSTSQKVPYSEQDKNDLMTNGYLKDDPTGAKTKSIVSDLNPVEKAKLTQTHAESSRVFDNKQTTRLQENNTRKQAFEAGAGTLATGITQSSTIAGASYTKDAAILSAEAQALNSSIQAGGSVVSMAASILNSAASIVSGLAGNIANLMVKN